MADARSNKPSMNWDAKDLRREWKRFEQHCMFTFYRSHFAKKTEEQGNYLMTFIGDKGREVNFTFTFPPGDDQKLEPMCAKYRGYVDPRHDQLTATVHFNRRKRGPNEKFDNFVTDLKLLVKFCGYADGGRMVRDALILCSYHAAVQEKCLDEGNKLRLESVIKIGQSQETSQEGLKVVGGQIDEDPKVNAVNKRPRRPRIY